MFRALSLRILQSRGARRRSLRDASAPRSTRRSGGTGKPAPRPLRSGALSLFSLVVLALPATASAKKTRIRVHNCSTQKATVCVYDGADAARTVARHRRTLKAGITWSPKCKSKLLGGKNTRRCKVYLVPEAGNACPVNPGGKRLRRVRKNATLYIGVEPQEPDPMRPNKPQTLRADIGDTFYCAVQPH